MHHSERDIALAERNNPRSPEAELTACGKRNRQEKATKKFLWAQAVRSAVRCDVLTLATKQLDAFSLGCRQGPAEQHHGRFGFALCAFLTQNQPGRRFSKK
jgi:hypothetical protein